jgi:sterol desaturase/sphingolipid hydroxylase (fatty acid hydroxylase superfamily)
MSDNGGVETTIHNERTKLTAAWLNGLAIAVFAIGGISPMFAALYGAAPITVTPAIGGLICFMASSALHYWARRTLKGLRQ